MQAWCMASSLTMLVRKHQGKRELTVYTASLVDEEVCCAVGSRLAPSSDATSSGLKADVAPSLHISSIADMLLSCTTS